MKMYTNIDQTFKLVEMGFKKPNGLEFLVRERDNPDNAQIVQRMAYSIGELIEMLNGVSEFEIAREGSGWGVYDELRAFTSEELIDALYDMIIVLNEKGII